MSIMRKEHYVKRTCENSVFFYPTPFCHIYGKSQKSFAIFALKSKNFCHTLEKAFFRTFFRALPPTKSLREVRRAKRGEMVRFSHEFFLLGCSQKRLFIFLFSSPDQKFCPTYGKSQKTFAISYQISRKFSHITSK